MIRRLLFGCRAFLSGKLPHPLQLGFHKNFSGKKLLREERLEEGYAYYLEQLQTYPRNAVMRYRLAKLARRLGKLEEAGEHFRMLVEEYPYTGRYATAFISMLVDAGNVTEAIRIARRAFACKPYSANFIDHVYTILSLSGNSRLIEKLLQEISELHPNECHHKIYLASIFFQFARHEDALKVIDEILAAPLTTRTTRTKVVELLVRYKYSDKAKEVCLAAIDRNDAECRLYCYLGWIYEEEGNWEDAKRCFLHAASDKSIAWNDLGFELCKVFLKHGDEKSLSVGKYKERFAKYFSIHSRLYLDALYGDIPGYDAERYRKNIEQGFGALCLSNFAVKSCDFSSKNVNIVDGMRNVIDAPAHFKKVVHLFGISQLLSADLDVHLTIGSLLQRCLNSEEAEGGRVYSHCVSGGHLRNMFLELATLDLNPNDVVVVIYPPCVIHDDAIIDIEAMNRLCVERGVEFFIFLLPSVHDIALPSAREKTMQEVWVDHGKAKGRGSSLCSALKNVHVNCVFLDYLVQRPHAMGETFTDVMHFNHRLNAAIAKEIYSKLGTEGNIPARMNSSVSVEKAEVRAIRFLKKQANEIYSCNRDIADWLKSVRDEKISAHNNVGALVMNCNPFTKGHLHLVKTALQQVDALYLFVVQEDLSFFPFPDRIEMIRRNLGDLGDSLCVAPSGEFIISSFSFPGYFTKEATLDTSDSTTDIAIFGSVIAPSLNITHRFVGEEPTCVVTKGYNDTMLRLLPSMGVQVHVIPRVEQGSLAISASQVRKAMKQKDCTGIKKLVPDATYEFLLEKKYVECE